MMIDRGGCHFAQKVHNAEIAGAVAVLIADNAQLCQNAPTGACNITACDYYCPIYGVIPDVYNQGGCECILPYLADDPVFPVSIPSFIITKYAADQMKACMLGQA